MGFPEPPPITKTPKKSDREIQDEIQRERRRATLRLGNKSNIVSSAGNRRPSPTGISQKTLVGGA